MIGRRKELMERKSYSISSRRLSGFYLRPDKEEETPGLGERRWVLLTPISTVPSLYNSTWPMHRIT